MAVIFEQIKKPNYFMVIPIIIFSASCSTNASGLVLYENLEREGDPYQRNLAIDEEKEIIFGYDEPLKSDYINHIDESDSGLFRYSVEKSGIIYNTATDISLPLDVKDGSRWSRGSIICSAKNKRGDFDILCKKNDFTWNYTYSKVVGIVKFENLCGYKKYCTYVLKTGDGIFSQKALSKIGNNQ